MSTGRVDEIITPKALSSLDEMLQKLGITRSAVADMTEDFIRLNGAIAGSKSFPEFNRNVAATEASLLRLQREQQNVIRATQQAEAATARNAMAQERLNNSINRSTGAYNALSAAYREATEVARNAGVVFGENSRQFQNAARSANFLRERLDAIDRPLGNYQRNVGNYASGFNGLGNSINQLTREFPAFTYSVQTGFMALSNNLPIFFDQIRQTRLEIARIRAEGQQVPGLLTQLSRSFFSWGTALSVGITLITVYGKEIGNFFKSLFSGKHAMDEFIERQKTLNSLWVKSGESAGAEIAKLNALYRAVENVNLPMKERLEAVKKLQDLYPEHLNNLTVDNAGTLELAKAYAKLKTEIIDTAYVQAAYNKISENTARIFEAEFKIINERGNNLKLRQDLNNAQQEENKLIASGARLRNANNDALDAGARASNQLATAQGKLAASDKIIFDAAKDREIAEKRNAAIQDQISGRVKRSGTGILGGGGEKAGNSGAKTGNNGADDELEALEYQYNEQIALARAKDKENADLEKEYFEQIKAYRKQYLENYKIDTEDFLNQQLLDTEFAASKEILIITEKFSNGEIKEKEYRRRIKALQKQSAAEAIDIQIKALEQIQAAQEIALTAGVGSKRDVQGTKNKITGLKIRSNQLKSDAGTDDAMAGRAKMIENAKEMISFANQAMSALEGVQQMVAANAQAKIDALEQEFALIQQNADAEKARVENSLLSNKEKARQISLIDAKTAQERKRITDKENEIKKKQAEYDKALNIAKIIQGTAVAVVTALSAGPVAGIVLAAIVGALGAAQLAVAISTPLPQFFKGTKNAPEGFAHVGERGTELQINPDGTMGLTPNKDTITYLQKGTQIIPHEELMRMVAKPESLQVFAAGTNDNRKVEKLLAENNELLKKQKRPVVHVHTDRWGEYSRQRNY